MVGLECWANNDDAVCFLVLMFLPIGKRHELVRRLCGLIKVAQGAKSDDIIQKELSLGGVQRPLPINFMESVVENKAVEVFRFGEFAGWVIEKPE